VSEFATPAESPGFLLWQVMLRWQRQINAALSPLQLTHAQFVILACTWWLGRQGESPNQLRIAQQAATDVKMTSEIVRKLETRGLVARTVDGTDSRAKTVRTTREGAALARRSIGVVERVDAEFFAHADQAQLMRVLSVLASGSWS
jgi:DNA-binding MarR family transcriptional regulator